METNMVKLLSLVCLICFSGICSGENFSVLNYGAKADGKTDDAKAFSDTWDAACSSNGAATISIPKGTYLVGPVRFDGPCKNVPSIKIKMNGYLKAVPDIKKYDSDWLFFGWVDRLTITGNGVFDGQGGIVWHLNQCRTNPKCKILPTSLKFVATTNTVVQGITSLNSMTFHFGVVECKNFHVRNIVINAPGDSPNTDGIHVERSSDVIIEKSKIGTGDDCISMGQGLSNVFVNNVECGPGHGLSIGSLGKYPNEKDVKDIVVRDCTLKETMNGVRIKSWEDTPSFSKVSNVTFENIVMDNVDNPVIIDQLYCPTGTCPAQQEASKVKISDVTFRNIRGSFTSDVGITLHCSGGYPCQNVRMEEVNLVYKGPKQPLKNSCMNVKPIYSGKQIPPPC